MKCLLPALLFLLLTPGLSAQATALSFQLTTGLLANNYGRKDPQAVPSIQGAHWEFGAGLLVTRRTRTGWAGETGLFFGRRNLRMSYEVDTPEVVRQVTLNPTFLYLPLRLVFGGPNPQPRSEWQRGGNPGGYLGLGLRYNFLTTDDPAPLVRSVAANLGGRLVPDIHVGYRWTIRGLYLGFGGALPLRTTIRDYTFGEISLNAFAGYTLPY